MNYKEAHEKLNGLRDEYWRDLGGDIVDTPEEMDRIAARMPSGKAVSRCRTLLNILGDLNVTPHDVLPWDDSPQAGAGVCFHRYHSGIACLNDGRTVAYVCALSMENPQPAGPPWEIDLTPEGVAGALEIMRSALPEEFRP